MGGVDARGRRPLARALPLSPSMNRRFAAVALALAGCSSSTPTLDPPASPDAGSTDGPGGFQHEIVVSMDLTVKAGEEKHVCQLVALPNDADANVVSISHEYT